MKLLKYKNTYFFCATHQAPLFKPPEWMTLIKTGLFDSRNSIDTSRLVPKYDLLHCYLKGDVATMAVRRLLQAEIEVGGIDENCFVCGTSFRKFVAAKAVGTTSANFPSHCRILIQDAFNERDMWNDMSDQIVLPQFLNYRERMGVTAVYARDHSSFADYLACVAILLDEGFFSAQDAVSFLAMHGHFLWGFAGTLRLKHFLTIANQFESAAIAFLRNGYVSKADWRGEQQYRWMAFFLERLTSFLYLRLLASDGFLTWNSDGSYNLAEGVVQGFNCNINTSCQLENLLVTGP